MHAIHACIGFQITLSNLGSYDAPSFISVAVSKWHPLPSHLAKDLKHVVLICVNIDAMGHKKPRKAKRMLWVLRTPSLPW